MEKILFTKARENIKYLRINLPRKLWELHEYNIKVLLKYLKVEYVETHVTFLNQ